MNERKISTYDFINGITSQFIQLIELSVLFLLFSVPVFTVFSSYACIGKCLSKKEGPKEGPLFLQYFHLFKSVCFANAPIMVAFGLITLFMLCVFAVSGSFYYYLLEGTYYRYIVIALTILALSYTISFFNVFTIVYNTISLPIYGYIKNSAIMVIICPLQSIVLIVVLLIVVLILYLKPFFLILSPVILVFFSKLGTHLYEQKIISYMTDQSLKV